MHFIWEGGVVPPNIDSMKDLMANKKPSRRGLGKATQAQDAQDVLHLKHIAHSHGCPMEVTLCDEILKQGWLPARKKRKCKKGIRFIKKNKARHFLHRGGYFETITCRLIGIHSKGEPMWAARLIPMARACSKAQPLVKSVTTSHAGMLVAGMLANASG